MCWNERVQKPLDSCLQVTDIGRLLGQGFNADSNLQMLCPHCCSSDMFVRSAAVHVFECVEVESCDMLHCSRYHEMPSSHVADVCASGDVRVVVLA